MSEDKLLFGDIATLAAAGSLNKLNEYNEYLELSDKRLSFMEYILKDQTF